MMLRSLPLQLIPVGLALVGFGLSATEAIAQTTYTFNANYDLSNGGSFLSPSGDLAQIDIVGNSTDASYDLTKLNGLTYLRTDLTTGKFTANSDPKTFGLQDFPLGFFALEGNGEDKLFGSETANGVTDFNTLKVTNFGTINITGGEGRFKGATGILSFTELGQQSTDPNIPYRGTLALTGSFKVVPVPEPLFNTTLLTISVIGSGVLLRRRHCKDTSS
ncbi:hypothetical protein BZZ01_03500 [Nostocales cyanobacterium HT-58-2]|nr:hypothetical protein BZZ01_03500 [Nostocales cyanobacterium HT-58-2]